MNTSQVIKPKRLRFSYNDDLTFLKEVVSENPFRDPSSWETIQKHLDILYKKSFSIKTLKNHLELLLAIFIKKDKNNPLRSGVEEPYCELDDLLREVSVLAATYEEAQAKKKMKVSKDKQLSELGKKAREMYATKELAPEQDNQSMNQPIYFAEEHDYCGLHFKQYLSDDLVDNMNISEVIVENVEIEQPPTPALILAPNFENKNTPSKKPHDPTADQQPGQQSTATPGNKRKILIPNRQRQNKISGQRNSALNYLTEKQTKDKEIKMKEFEVEERKLILEERKIALAERQLNLEEAKFELDRTERLEKIKSEAEEKKMTSQLLKCQQDLIENLVLQKSQGNQ